MIITVDRNRKNKNKIKKEVYSKSGRNSSIGMKIKKKLTIENIKYNNPNANIITNEISFTP